MLRFVGRLFVFYLAVAAFGMLLAIAAATVYAHPLIVLVFLLGVVSAVIGFAVARATPFQQLCQELVDMLDEGRHHHAS